MRRVYFCDRLYTEEELPIEFRLFVPSSKTVKKTYQPPKIKSKKEKKAEEEDKIEEAVEEEEEEERKE